MTKISELVFSKHSARPIGTAVITLFIIVFTPIYLFSAETAPPSDQCEKAKSELAVAGGYRANGEIDKALEAYRAIVKERSSCRAQAAEAQLHIGEHFQAKKMVKEAAEAFEAVVRNFKDQPDLCIAALGKMARTYKASCKLEQALQSYKRIIDGYPSCPSDCADAMLARATIFEEASAYQKAESELRKLMKAYGANPALKPRCREAHYRIACVMKVAGRLDEALKTFAGIKDDPFDTYAATALLKRGEILSGQGKPDEALAEFQKLVDSYPQHKNTCLQARFLMADALLEKKDMAAVQAIAKEVLKEEATLKGYPHMYYDIMSLQYRAGDTDWRETAKKYYAAMKAFGYGGRADFCPVEIAYYYEKDLPKAEKLAADFVAKHPDHALSPEAAFIRGKCLFLKGDKDGALAVFDAMIAAFDGRYSYTYTNAALELSADILTELGRTSEAVDRLQRITTGNAVETASKYQRIGSTYLLAKNWKEASQAFTRIIAIKNVPADAVYQAFYGLADCYCRMGEITLANDYLRKIIDQSPGSTWASKARGMLYLWNMTDRTASEERGTSSP